MLLNICFALGQSRKTVYLCNMRRATLFILLFLSAALHAQQTFRGRVVDAETGEPLPYVEISVSQKLRTLSNRHGIFAVEARTKNMLIFSHVGYEEVEMVPTDKVVSGTAA